MHGTALDIESQAIRRHRDEAIKVNRRACDVMARYHPERDILPLLKAEVARRKLKPRPQPTPKPRKASWSLSSFSRSHCAEGYGCWLVGSPMPTRRAARDILKEVTREFGFHLVDVVGPARHRHLVKARQKIAYRIATETKLSLPQIGKVMGGRDHTTIIHAVRAYCRIHGIEPPRGMGWGNKFKGRPTNAHKGLGAT